MEDRVLIAALFLQEAVYSSRSMQAAAGSIGAAEQSGDGPGTCGLGKAAAVMLELSPRGDELFQSLWHEAPAETSLQRIRGVMTQWVKAHDVFDRKRNHFIKGFRGENGFDRSKYSADQQASYEEGLKSINDEVDAGRRDAAQRLLEIA